MSIGAELDIHLGRKAAGTDTRSRGVCKQYPSNAIDRPAPCRYMPAMAASIETLPILVVPDPILKARARQVATADMEKARTLVPRMFATMYAAPGIGLAAPQVGVALRIAVIDLMANDKSAPYVLINPEVIARSDELATREEGCLSLPGQYADVTRPARVTIRYLDIEGAKRQIDAEGLLSACMQHEIDHLDGVLFVDHLSALKRNMILRRLAKELRQKRAEAM